MSMLTTSTPSSGKRAELQQVILKAAGRMIGDLDPFEAQETISFLLTAYADSASARELPEMMSNNNYVMHHLLRHICEIEFAQRQLDELPEETIPSLLKIA